MVVVDEVGKAVVDALMVWHVRIGRMDSHRLGHDFRQRPAALDEFVINPATTDLVAGQEPFLEFAIKACSFLI